MLRLPMPSRSERRIIVAELQRQVIPVLQIPSGEAQPHLRPGAH